MYSGAKVTYKRARAVTVSDSEDSDYRPAQAVTPSDSEDSDYRPSKRVRKSSATSSLSRWAAKSDRDSNASESEDEETSTDDEGPSEHKKATQYTQEQREEITRVLKCGKKDYYGMLGLEESCSERDIEGAYNKLKPLTNPNNNKFKDAEIAFKMIGEAYQILSDSEERKKYKEKREDYREKGLLEPLYSWDEEFASNASGTDSIDSDDDVSKDEEHEPDEFRKNIYKEATPFVHNLLEDPDDFASEAEIQSLNMRITKQNKKEGFERDEFHISLRFLHIIGLSARDALASLERDPDDGEAKIKLKKLGKELKEWVRINSYAPEWLDSLNGNLREGGSGKNNGKKDTQMLAEQMLVEWLKDSQQSTDRLVAELKKACNLTSLKLPIRNRFGDRRIN